MGTDTYSVYSKFTSAEMLGDATDLMSDYTIVSKQHSIDPVVIGSKYDIKSSTLKTQYTNKATPMIDDEEDDDDDIDMSGLTTPIGGTSVSSGRIFTQSS